jgi:type I restriction enzyme S subunit
LKAETVPLSKVCEIENGFAFKSIDFKEKGIPLLRISNIANEKVSFDKGAVYLEECSLKTHEKFVVKKGDVVIALSGATTGKYGIYLHDYPCLLNQRIGLIRNDNSSSLNSKYFYFYLNVLKSEILRKAQGAAQPNISTKDIGRFEIPLPPLAEQQKIAAILDAADALKQKDQQLIDYYSALSQSLFLDMFGDPIGTEFLFKDIAENNGKGTFSNGPFGSDLLTSELTKEGVPVIYIRDISKGTYIRKSNVFVTQEKADYLANCQIETNDVLISKVGTPPGIAALYPKGETRGIITQDVIRIRVDENISTPEFIQYWFNSSLGSRALASIIVEGTRMRFGLGDLKMTTIVIPDLKLQKKFTKRIKVIEAQKQQAQASLDQSNNLFNSLLQKAFAGELTQQSEQVA